MHVFPVGMDARQWKVFYVHFKMKQVFFFYISQFVQKHPPTCLFFNFIFCFFRHVTLNILPFYPTFSILDVSVFHTSKFGG